MSLLEPPTGRPRWRRRLRQRRQGQSQALTSLPAPNMKSMMALRNALRQQLASHSRLPVITPASSSYSIASSSSRRHLHTSPALDPKDDVQVLTEMSKKSNPAVEAVGEAVGEAVEETVVADTGNAAVSEPSERYAGEFLKTASACHRPPDSLIFRLNFLAHRPRQQRFRSFEISSQIDSGRAPQTRETSSSIKATLGPSFQARFRPGATSGHSSLGRRLLLGFTPSRIRQHQNSWRSCLLDTQDPATEGNR